MTDQPTEHGKPSSGHSERWLDALARPRRINELAAEGLTAIEIAGVRP